VLTFGELFAGIGGFSVGFERAGMRCLWKAEIDARCQDVLRTHWPDVPNLGDVKHVGRDTEPVDIICGGFPCQDVSIAGNRKGLAGERSGLWFEFHRILGELKPEWVVIENVTGLLSSNKGRDFATILHGLEELRYVVCWRVLDAQYFGVAQRRRRVFIVGHLGDGRAAEVLLESQSSAGDTAPSRETGEANTRTTATGIDVRNYREQPDEISGTLQSKKTGGYSLNYINPIVTYGIDKQRNVNTEHIGALQAHKSGGSSQVVAVSFRGRDDGVHAECEKSDVSPALRASQGGSDKLFVAFGGGNTSGPIDIATTCMAHGSGRYDFASETFVAQEPVAYNWQSGGDVRLSFGLPNLQVSQVPAVGVRRLTPTECERLQGFPDGWTKKVGFTTSQNDSARYRQLGNAVCVPVAEWIGRQIVAVESL